ncbi:cytochrome c3 family protein [Halodesulfovibrio marinisediminis]|uniref:Class III cytochrome C family protein n=1 Tax=Halodesulfovibrio marinisediminis DSM 17456 TaxID=1121457 RepID=A0A1N6EB82_9BACT|nr:cytochrome c3 family protein [Halodesulfovibrio marinisediminis]SIN80292.1 Class III cytochrome C family protein [Halodesulfovibrio marinisediminis DSM 17456]
MKSIAPYWLNNILGKLLRISAILSIVLCCYSMAIAFEAPKAILMMELTKKPVAFDHVPHAELECVQCHHMVEGRQSFQMCSACHQAKDKKAENSYYKVIHNKKTANPEMSTCITCHKEIAGKDKKKRKALTGCKKSKCHE